MVFLGAPSALNTSLALRQAIWRKVHADWPVCGIPDVLHVDHGSDFTSIHLDQAAADLRFQLIYSAIARPQGRGKIERLFRTINTELLPELPGNLQAGKPASRLRLSLPELDAALGAFIVSTYNTRVHGEIGASPLAAWRGDGWLSRMPESLEQLDTLLVMVAKPRVVHRDGIYFGSEEAMGRPAGVGIIVGGCNRWTFPMTQVDDLSRSLAVFDQNTSLIVVVELSEASWLVAGLVPGVDRQPLKKLAPDPDALLRLLERWKAEAMKTGQTIGRIALAYEAGRDGFWLARWLAWCMCGRPLERKGFV